MHAVTRLTLSILLVSIPVSSTPLRADDSRPGRVTLGAGHAEIPAFARKYGFSCSVCHDPIPRLTEFGETFAGNGFQISVEEEPRDTIDTGDPLLRLMQDVPLAIRFDGYAQANTLGDGREVSNDLSFPWGIKLLSGGPIARNVSYYVYFFLSERGEIAGLEDAYLQFTDIWSSGVSIMAGQFQVSDPLFKRELRLEFEDYMLYRIRMGDARADLTYDRGVMVPFSPWENGDWVLGVVNGQGLRDATESRQYDRDNSKNLFARYSHSLGPVRLGVFGLYGRERANDISNEIVWFGPDASIALGAWGELNLQYLRRQDTRPFFDTPDAPSDTWANSVLAELIWWPAGANGRWWVTGLWNWIDASDPIVSLRINEQAFVPKYNAIAADVSWLFWRNVRFTSEIAWDIERDGARFVVGVVSAF